MWNLERFQNDIRTSVEQMLTLLEERSQGHIVDNMAPEILERPYLNEMRRLVNILVGHMVENHGRIPTRHQREQYALGIVTLFPSLGEPQRKAMSTFTILMVSCNSIDEHLRKRGQQPYLFGVGGSPRLIDHFYIALDKKLIPCLAGGSLSAFDELFKTHFVFSVMHDDALLNFYTFMQTTVYRIDIGITKEAPRVKELRAKLLN
ncbi:uncharacterized protein LOC118782888 [Megalops cyprinoides]|uniref:uncharacterized protein LOC118782888 n=1 Tax=Megalops cyprinoides TaxID=118141 RepID=UPI0018641C0F|nr:uncharacterized protein LOC118782888 [Megalops cyprinoides]